MIRQGRQVAERVDGLEKTVPCDLCNGTGELDNDPECLLPCPGCDGEGRMVDEPYAVRWRVNINFNGRKTGGGQSKELVVKEDDPFRAIGQVVSEAVRDPAHGGSLFLTRVSAEHVKHDGETMVVPARRGGKSFTTAAMRIRAVAEGGTINGTYGLEPGSALEAFRRDLLRVLGGEA